MSNKDYKKQRDWVGMARARDRDDRPALKQVHSEKGMTVATDGVRLYAASVGEKFPEFKGMIESINPEAGITVLVDPRYLVEALPKAGEAHTVAIHFSSETEPIEVGWTDEQGVDRYAMIMPQNGYKGSGITWRPVDPKETEETKENQS